MPITLIEVPTVVNSSANSFNTRSELAVAFRIGFAASSRPEYSSAQNTLSGGEDAT